METASEWISPWWQASCLPSWDVAGVRVPSLSVWHVFALESLGNAFVAGGRCDRDASAALLILARTDREGGRRLMLDGRHRKRAMRRILRAIRRVDDVTLYRACADYVRSCTHTARRWKSQKEGGGLACPYQWHLVRSLCRDYHMDDETAWNTPYAYARCLYDTSAEAGGDETLMKPEYQQLDDAIAQEATA
jgi:hypothetical protein